MPTDNPRITITVSPEMQEQLKEYQHAHRMKNQTQTIVSLIERGMGKIQNQGNKKPSMPEDTEGSYIKKYSSLDLHGRKVVNALIDLETERMTSAHMQNAIVYDITEFRISRQAASAGTGVYLGPENFRRVIARRDGLPRKASFGVPVSGNSMEPRYHDGDILIIADEQPEMHQVGLAMMGEYGYVKIRGNGELISLNKDYAPIHMEEGAEFKGKVIGVLDQSAIIEELDDDE